MNAESRIAELEGRLRGLAFREAERVAQNAALARQVEALTKHVEALSARLGLNSTNSNKPPSSDAPKDRAAGNKAKADRKNNKCKRGGQRCSDCFEIPCWSSERSS